MSEEAPKNATKPQGLTPEGYVIPERFRDRLIEPPKAAVRDALQHDRQEPLGPVVLTVDAQDIGRFYANHATPYEYNQYLLSRFKDLGVPIEGMLRHKLVMGAIAKVRPDPGMQDGFVRYIWLPIETMEVLARAGKGMVH
jgi:hypothetical protein